MDNNKYTPIYHAYRNNHTDIMKELLKYSKKNEKIMLVSDPCYFNYAMSHNDEELLQLIKDNDVSSKTIIVFLLCF